MENQRIDVYTSFHKGIRKLLFELLVDIGKADFRVDKVTSEICEEVQRAIKLLREHGRIEDQVFHAAIEARDPGATAELVEQHRFEEELLAGLEGQVMRLREAESRMRPRLGLHLYRSLGMFCSSYLDHLAAEEEHLMPRFWDHFSDEELLALRAQAQELLPPADMLEWLTVVIPALQLSEQASVLGAMRATKPGSFDEALAGLRPFLDDVQWADLVLMLGTD